MPNKDSVELREIYDEACKKLERKEFRYGNSNRAGTRHGVNISDVKTILRAALSKVEAHTAAQIAAYRDRTSTGGRPLSAPPNIVKMPVPCTTCGTEEYADWFLYPHQVYNAVYPGGVGHDCLPCFCERLLSDDEVVASLRARLTTGQKEQK
jgi:hypothetical protein